jgi:hypothetical protein
MGGRSERRPATASVQKTVNVVRQVLAMAVTDNRLVLNPVDGVELPSVTAVEQRFLTLEQLRACDAAGAPAPLCTCSETADCDSGE